jgi:hypothetical protein
MEQLKLITEQQLEADRVKRSRQVFKNQYALLRYFNFDTRLECDGNCGLYKDDDDDTPCYCERERPNETFNEDHYQAFMLLHNLGLKIKSKEGGILSICNLFEIGTLLDKFEKFTNIYSNGVTHYLEISIHADRYASILALFPPKLKGYGQYLHKINDVGFNAMIDDGYAGMCDRYAL